MHLIYQPINSMQNIKCVWFCCHWWLVDHEMCDLLWFRNDVNIAYSKNQKAEVFIYLQWCHFALKYKNKSFPPNILVFYLFTFIFLCSRHNAKYLVTFSDFDYAVSFVIKFLYVWIAFEINDKSKSSRKSFLTQIWTVNNEKLWK